MKLLNEKKQTEDGNKKLRLWEIKTKIFYEDDYKTPETYIVACNHVGDEWIFITSSDGWNGHGGYSMWQKVEE
jgi:hypothetical protein